MQPDNHPQMPIGHPCAFARARLGDPFVAQTIDAYNRLLNRKNDLLSHGDYIEAWKALVHLREIEKQLESYCFPSRDPLSP